ncbi:GldL-related protein [Gelidibacter maritimus]|uniref:GldL-related protein n=1 Tax=Gelidibacter maritimus TaxID=2761487 RepID=UPI003744A5AF
MNLKLFILPLILFLSGFVFVIIGSLFKIMHWQFAVEALIVGMTLKVVALIMAIFKLIKIYNTNTN